MISANEKIYLLLSSDTTLTDMLGLNAPFYDDTGTETRANSIVPADMVKRKLNTPFITIQEGSETKIGSNLKDESFFIRCYNDIRKSYVRVNEILDRVRDLLDGADLELSDRVLVKVSFESRLPGLEEEGMELKFKEERYRLQVL